MSEKKFRFSLATVLEVRKQATERAMQALARAMHHREAQAATVAAAEARLREATAAGPRAGTTGPEGLRRSAAFRQHAHQRVTEAQKTLQHLQQKEREARHALANARHAEEALYELRDEEKAKHTKALRDAQQAFLDEQAVTRHQHDHPLLS